MSKELIISQTQIENRIFTFRRVQVMVDYHLAELYGVDTKRINEQVKRNIKRFPQSFMFQLSASEWESLQWQIATTKRRTLPYVFTEQGVAMLLSKNTGKQLTLDIQKASEQYGNIELKLFDKSHDRFLIIDGSAVYHLGASLKDLGKKWFAFSKMDKSSVDSILNSILKTV